MKLGDAWVVIEPNVNDINHAICGNRRNCVIALAVDRQFNLKGTGYTSVDANDIGITYKGIRYHYKPNRSMMTYLRTFDYIGEKKGIEEARQATKPKGFKCRFISSDYIAPPATEARKKRINDLRRERIAAAKAAGTYQPARRRYAGV